jgi:hypothetical protein
LCGGVVVQKTTPTIHLSKRFFFFEFGQFIQHVVLYLMTAVEPSNGANLFSDPFDNLNAKWTTADTIPPVFSHLSVESDDVPR